MLSVVVIAKNEADRIKDCLASVPFADELLVLDSGSEDNTVEIAREAGAKVLELDWPGQVAQKNRGLEYATGDWVLSLDADERLSMQAAEELRNVLSSESAQVNGYSFPRRSQWLGRWIRHGRWYPDRKVWLVRRSAGTWVGDDPHDKLEVDGVVQRLSGDILHTPYRSMSEHLMTIDRYTEQHAASLFGRGVRAHWWDVAFRPPLHFVDSYLLRRGFLDGVPGMALAGLGTSYVLCKWYRLWRLHNP